MTTTLATLEVPSNHTPPLLSKVDISIMIKQPAVVGSALATPAGGTNSPVAIRQRSSYNVAAPPLTTVTTRKMGALGTATSASTNQIAGGATQKFEASRNLYTAETLLHHKRRLGNDSSAPNDKRGKDLLVATNAQQSKGIHTKTTAASKKTDGSVIPGLLNSRWAPNIDQGKPYPQKDPRRKSLT